MQQSTFFSVNQSLNKEDVYATLGDNKVRTAYMSGWKIENMIAKNKNSNFHPHLT